VILYPRQLANLLFLREWLEVCSFIDGRNKTRGAKFDVLDVTREGGNLSVTCRDDLGVVILAVENAKKAKAA
jgi:hypothetical protein